MSTIPPTGAAGPAASAPVASSGAPTAAAQQDRFMKLLVAQMKNQDPLNPMDNAQMTSQVAQINTVGGIEKLNTTVESLLAAFNGMQAQTAMQLPGHSVLVEGSSLTLANGSARGGVDLAADADAVNVDILDGAGRVVRTIALGACDTGVRSFTWDGKAADGSAVADGSWRMRVTATTAGKPVEAAALTAARVQSVSTRDGGTQVDLGSLGTRAWSAIQSFL